MNIRERIGAFWSGDRPDQIPYTIYQNEWRHYASDPAWDALFQNGLGVTVGLRTYRQVLHEVDSIHDSLSGVIRHRLITPVGELLATWLPGEKMDDWPSKYFLETGQDYRVMTYIVNHTEILPDYSNYLTQSAELPEYYIPLVDIGNSPLLKIMLDLTGMENFGLHLYEYQDEMMELYAALRQQFHRICLIAAEGPGRFVSNPESFSADTLGPKRFRDYVLNCYNENFPLIQASGKIVGSHFDGKTVSCKELIRMAPINLIESLTPPPEGDQTLADARLSWPDKLFWCNINLDF